MRLIAACILALCLFARASLADQPLLRPSRDVDVTYRATAASQPEQRVRWLAAARLMRIDPPVPGLYVIVDYMARRMSVVREATHSVVQMAIPDNVAGVMSDKGAGGYVRHGNATVAGLGCTEWQTLDRQSQPVLVCLTTDGVLLRAGTLEQTLVNAVSVTYAPQDPDLFRVPPGYTVHAAGAAQ